MILKNIFIITIFYCYSFAQHYLWPLQAEKELTAIFGEERPGRYHTGIDVRTFGEIGYNLIAIDDGYISRIRTSSKGYGKTIYLKLNDGNTAVYAHLDHFTPKLDNLVNALHQHYGKYTIDHKIEPNEHPVKKGDIIGYSGDTGGVSGPHLHFEIRDHNGQPVNPFKHSLSIPDHLSPEVTSLAIIPLNEKAEIEGFSEQQIYPLQKINEKKYVLADTILVSGNIGFAVKALDKISGQHFNYGIYGINFLLDDQLIYSMQYDTIYWENTNSIYSERSFSLSRSGYGKFYHIFSHHNNQELSFINKQSKPGFIFDQKVPHNAIIEIWDYANNAIEIHAYFISDTLPKFDYSTDFQNNNCKVIFNKTQTVRPHFFLTGEYHEDQIIPTEYSDIGNNTYLIENIIPPLNVLRISGKNNVGISSIPTFHMKQQRDYKNIEGEFNIKHYEHGIIITFKEKMFSGQNAYLAIKKKGIIYSHKLIRNSKVTLSSNLLTPMELKNADEIRVYYDSYTPYEIFSMDLSGDIIYPDSSFQIKLLENNIIVKGDAQTFYDTTYIWAHPVKMSLPKEGKYLAGPYFLKPYLIPFNNEMELNIALESFHSFMNLGIYYFDQNMSEWIYLPSQITADSMYVSTSILSGEIFAVIEENTPPGLSDFIPDINGTYYSSEIEHISFYIEDTFSGIEGEADVIVKLDDNVVIPEYNTYQKKIRYPLKYNLKKGTHTLYVQVSDNVGNRSIVEGEFFIK